MQQMFENSHYQCYRNKDAFQQYKKRQLFPLGQVKTLVVPQATYGENGHKLNSSDIPAKFWEKRKPD